MVNLRNNIIISNNQIIELKRYVQIIYTRYVRIKHISKGVRESKYCDEVLSKFATLFQQTTADLESCNQSRSESGLMVPFIGNCFLYNFRPDVYKVVHNTASSGCMTLYLSDLRCASTNLTYGPHKTW